VRGLAGGRRSLGETQGGSKTSSESCQTDHFLEQEEVSQVRKRIARATQGLWLWVHVYVKGGELLFTVVPRMAIVED
jgi:hypothetical protein